MNDVFEHHMNAMLVHYTSGASHTYALPIELVLTTLADIGLSAFAESDAGAAEVDDAINGYKTSMSDTVSASKESATKGVESLKASSGDSGAVADFASLMSQEEVKQQKAAHDRIAKNFDHLIEVGKKHPHQQKRILSLTQQIGPFFANLLASVGEFFSGLGNSIKDFFVDAGKWFEGAANSIADWSEGAVNSVGDFFGF